MISKDSGTKRRPKGYTISAVADYYEIHQQTLRMYEREGLLTPSRSVGNVRLYTDEDIARLEIILQLTRELGVNLAGVEIILNMREKMDQMQAEFNRFFEMLRDYVARSAANPEAGLSEALVPTRLTSIVRPLLRRERPGLKEYDGQDEQVD
ncbi:MAG: MerR family transcriptional regulator [Acidobacteriota bacterium]